MPLNWPVRRRNQELPTRRALITTRDVRELDPAEAKDVMRWAAGALLKAALREAEGHGERG
jgi:hypothetical protein